MFREMVIEILIYALVLAAIFIAAVNFIEWTNPHVPTIYEMEMGVRR